MKKKKRRVKVILQRYLFTKKVAILASYDKLPKMGQCNAAVHNYKKSSSNCEGC
jgi:hypothetical protein